MVWYGSGSTSHYGAPDEPIAPKTKVGCLLIFLVIVVAVCYYLFKTYGK